MGKILPILLEATQHAGPERRKELSQKIDPTLTYEFADGTKKPVRELIQSDSINSTTLIQAEVYNEVLDGAAGAVCMRNALDVLNVNSNSFRLNFGTAATYAAEVAEGSEIPVAVQPYNATTFAIKKYGVRPLITRELVNDGLFDIIASEIRYAGMNLEQRLNYNSLSHMLQYSGNEFDTGGSSQGVKAIAKARSVNRAAGFNPTGVIMHPEAEGIVLQDFTSAGGYYPVGNTATSGVTPQILGLQAYVCGDGDNSSSYTWGFAADGEIGMLVYDRRFAAKIAMRQDIGVEQYNDPVRDLVGLSCTMRFDTQANLNSSSTCTALTRIVY